MRKAGVDELPKEAEEENGEENHFEFGSPANTVKALNAVNTYQSPFEEEYLKTLEKRKKPLQA